MTPRQNLFVAEYTLSRNATSAAVKAGYSPRTARQMGSENLTKPDIRAAVAEHEQATARKLELEREKVLAGLLEAVEVARAQGDPGAMVRAWSEVARVCGYHAPDRAVKVHVDVAMKRTIAALETLPDAELMALVTESGATT